MTKYLLAVLLLAAPCAAFAQDLPKVDLLLPPQLAKGAPFYQDARVKIDDAIVPVTQDSLPDGQLAAYQPEQNRVVVSNSKTADESAKGTALLEVIDAMQAGAVAPAAGSAK